MERSPKPPQISSAGMLPSKPHKATRYPAPLQCPIQLIKPLTKKEKRRNTPANPAYSRIRFPGYARPPIAKTDSTHTLSKIRVFMELLSDSRWKKADNAMSAPAPAPRAIRPLLFLQPKTFPAAFSSRKSIKKLYRRYTSM